MINDIEIAKKGSTQLDETGSVLVEAALSVSFLAVFAIGVFQIGLYMWQSLQLEAAVQAGAFYATSYTARNGWNGIVSATDTANNNTPIKITTNSPNEIKSIVENALTGVAGTINVSATQVTARWGCQTGTSITLDGPTCDSSGCPAVGTSYKCSFPGIYVTITATLTGKSLKVSNLFDLSGLLLYPITRTTVVRIQ